MNKADASTISKSANESISGTQRDLIEGKSSSIDSLFPLIDQTLQHVTTPKVITMIISYYFLLQCLFASLWPNNHFYYVHDTITNRIFEIINYIFFFSAQDENWSSYLITFIIVAVAFVISYTWIAFQLYYYSEHRFFKAGLYINAIVFDVILPVFVIPSAALVGKTFTHLNGSSDIKWVIFLILSAIIAIGFFAGYFVIYSFTIHSTYLKITPSASHDSKPYLILMIMNACSIILSYFFTIYPDWMCVVLLQGAHFCVSLLILLIMFNMPFYQPMSNAVLSAFLIATMANDVLLSIVACIPNVFDLIPLIATVAAFIIGIFVMNFIFKRKTRKICKELSTNDKTEDLKWVYYEELGLNSNERKPLLYLFTGLQNACPLFVDWSLSKFVLSHHQSSGAVCDVLKVLSFFPSETRQLSVAFNMICRRNNLSIFERFLIYQVHRVKIMRQSSISVDATDKLMELKTQSKDLEGELRYFWTLDKPFISFTEVYAEKEQSLRALWEEAIRDYPNNPRMAQEYAKFLTECSTMFDDAIMMSQRSTLIENGRNFSTDIAFRSMVQIFQIYLKNNIVDFKGNVIRKDFGAPSKSNSSQLSSKSGSQGSDMTSSGSEISIDAELEDMISKQILTHGRMRMALHSAIDDRKTCSMQYNLIYSVVLTIIMIAGFIVMYFIIDSLFDSQKTSMQRMVSVSNLRFYIDITQYAVFYRAINESGKLFNLEFYAELQGYDDGGHIPYVKLLENYDQQINDYVDHSREYMGTMLNEIVQMSHDGTNIYELAYLVMEDSTNLTIYYEGHKLDPKIANLKDNIVYILNSQIDMARDDNASQWFYSTKMCDHASNHGEFMDKSGELFNIFYYDQKNKCDTLEKTLFYTMIILTIGVFFLLFIPQLFFVLSFNKELAKGLDALHNVTQESKDEAMKHLYKGSQDDPTPIGKVNHTMSTWVKRGIVWFFLAVLISLCTFGMFYYAYITCKDVAMQNGWLLYSAWRLSCCASSGLRILQSVVFNGSVHSPFYDPPYIREDAKKQLSLLN